MSFNYRLPESWRWVTVEDVQSAEKRSTITGPFGSSIGSKFFVDQGVPVIRGNNLKLGSEKFVDDGFVFITEEKAEELKGYKAYPGDLLFTAAGTIGQVGIIPDNCSYEYYIISNKQMRARFDPSKIDAMFAYYWFSSNPMVAYIKVLNTGSTIPLINLGILRKLPIPLPPLDEQIKIKSHLVSLDNKIEVNRQTNQTLEAIAQTLFKSWFVDFDPVKAKLSVLAAGGSAEAAERAAMCAISARDEASLNTLQTEHPEAYAELARTAALFPSAMQDAELGEIPEGWEVGTLGDNYNVVMGQSPKGDTYNEVKEGQLFFQGRAEFGWRYPTPRLYTSSPKRVASKGDILMSVRAPVGDLNIALEDCCIGRGLSALRHNSGSTSFTYYQLKSLQTQLDRFNGEGTVFGSINQKDLKSLLTINPSNSFINRFDQFCSLLDKEIEGRSIESIKLSELRDTLLPKLLSGVVKTGVDSSEVVANVF